MLQRPEPLNLSNWRQSPYSRWSFHHVREVIPSERIEAGNQILFPFERSDRELEGINFEGPSSETWTLEKLLKISNTDALLVAHQGKLVHEWYVDEDVSQHPHIAFSVSKSITATTAGVLVEQGLLNPDAMVTEYVAELRGSAYGDCTVQQVLDMTVSLDFDEIYTATGGKFVDYRMSTSWHPSPAEMMNYGLHEFITSLKKGSGSHGHAFAYKSPNSDLLGWIMERASNERLANLYSRYLWQPMGAEGDAYVTVDRKGAARSAGGFCALPRDLLRFGELMRNQGRTGERQVIPAEWIQECIDGGDPEVWARGESAKEFTRGSYRNKWYQTGNEHRAFLAIGIHSQWIYIDPVAETVIVKLSSQTDPLSQQLDPIYLRAFDTICRAI
ncbi:MAG: serine hydrolase domain-containing protein [Gammaproteobacteria bacterium]